MRFNLLLLFVLISLYCKSQQESQFSFISDESNLSFHESYMEWQEDRLSGIKSNPIYINGKRLYLLRDYNILTNSEYKAIKSYIIVYGAILSANELRLINQLSSAKINSILPYIHFDASKTQNQSSSTNERKTQHEVLLRIKPDINHADHYKTTNNQEVSSSTYYGSPLYLGLKHKGKLGRNISWGLVAEKDPGEVAWISNENFLPEKYNSSEIKPGIDHFKGYLQIKDLGIVENFILGQYALQWGLGSHIGQVFSPQSNTFNPNLYPPKGEYAYSGFSESNYFQGAFCKLRSNALALSFFWSGQHYDASLYQDNGKVYFKSLNTSGYHRTASEINRKNSLGFLSKGIQLEYETTNTVSHISCSNHLSQHPLLLENKVAITKNKYLKETTLISMDYTLHLQHHFFQAEVSSNTDMDLAALLHYRYTFSPSIKWNLGMRYYSPSYYSHFCNSYSAFHRQNNELGFRMGIELEFAIPLEVYFSTDYAKRVRTTFSDKENTLRENILHCEYNLSKQHHLLLGVKLKGDDQNQASTMPISKDRLSVQMSYGYDPSLHLSLKLNSYYRYNPIDQYRNTAMGLSSKYQSKNKKLNLKYGIMIYRGNNDSAAVYAYTGGLSESFCFSQFYGSGVQHQFHIMFRFMKNLKSEMLYKYNKKVENSSLQKNTHEVSFQIKYAIK